MLVLCRTNIRLERAAKRLDLLWEETESLYQTTALKSQLCELRNMITVGVPYRKMRPVPQRKPWIAFQYRLPVQEYAGAEYCFIRLNNYNEQSTDEAPGMIFAAGLGTRFKPWTDKHPKALAVVNGKVYCNTILNTCSNTVLPM